MAFWRDDPKAKFLPRTGESFVGSDFLQRQLQGTPDMPTAGTAGLTPIQELIQQKLGPLLQNIQEGGQLATDQYRSTLAGDYDPRTSPYYEALRGEADYLKRKGTTALRREHELGGTLMDTNAMGVRGAFINRADSALMQELGRLFESERNRQERAAVGIQTVGARQAQGMAAVGGIAEAERGIEQQRANALYQQAIQQILFPYQYQTSLANAMMNYTGPLYARGGGASSGAQLFQGGMSAIGAAGGIGPMFSGAGGAIGGAAGGIGAAGSAAIGGIGSAIGGVGSAIGGVAGGIGGLIAAI